VTASPRMRISRSNASRCSNVGSSIFVTSDRCLRIVADAPAANLRNAGEIVARYGGEELAILLPGSDLAKGSELGRRLPEAVRTLDVAVGGNKPHITISVGVASMSPAHEADPLDPRPTRLVEAADQALYGAKMGGRNQVTDRSDCR
jgi:diguanylate cyclase (GGDEF)-like protein